MGFEVSAAQQPVAMKLGDTLTSNDVQSIVGGGSGSWIELNAEDHPGAAFVVWRMESEERSPECEERARRLVAAFNACAGIPIEVLEANAAGGLPFSVADQIDQRVLISKLLAAAKKVEPFLCGFDDDNTQDGVREMLRDLRAAIDSAKRAGSCTTRMPDGGPAFPVDNIVARDERGHLQGHEISSAGMSLRDHFAGLAMQSILSTVDSWRDNEFIPVSGKSTMENNALCAYAQADAMLKARAAS